MASRRTRALLSTVTLAVTIPLALSGCAPTTTPDGSDGDVITFWHYYGPEDSPTGGPLFALIDRYNATNPEMKVELRNVPIGDFNRTLTQAAASKTLPDIALINAFDTRAMAEAGVIQSLESRVAEWGEADDYFEAIWDTTQYEDAAYGVPHLADAYALYYNTSMFEEAGLSVPTTWDEVETAAAALTTADRFGLAISGIEGVEGATAVFLRVLAAGSDIDDLDSAAAQAGVDQLSRMVNDGSMSKAVLTWGETDIKNQFVNEQAAMMIDSATDVSIVRSEAPDLKWTVAALPKDVASPTFLQAENLTITSTSKHADEAWKVIKYMQQADVLMEYLPERNKLSARSDIAQDVVAGDPEREVFAGLLSSAWAPTGGAADHFNEVFTYVQEVLQQTVSGSASAEQALTAAKQKIDGLIK